MDMKVNTSKGRLTNSSTNSFRPISVHSNTSFIFVYTERIQAFNNNLIWTNQVEISESQDPTLFYAILEIGENVNVSKSITLENRPEPYGKGTPNSTTNIYQSQEL